jgi:hypothetical protein
VNERKDIAAQIEMHARLKDKNQIIFLFSGTAYPSGAPEFTPGF